MRVEGNANRVNAQDYYRVQRQFQRLPEYDEQRRETFRHNVLDEERTRRLREQLENEIDRISRVTEAFDRRMEFLLHEEEEQIYIQIVDLETEAIIREVPPEEILEFVSHMEEMVGVFLDQYI